MRSADLAARQRHADQERLAVAAAVSGIERQVEEVVLGIAFLLPAVDVEVLAEVAFAIHQADADQRQAEVAGALEVVAGEHAEAAGVDRHAFVHAELGREVGDAIALGERRRDRAGLSPLVARGVGLLKPGVGGEVRIEAVLDAVQVGEEAVVVCELFEPILVDWRRAA